MSTANLPPIGAKIRVTTTWPSGTTVVTEGIVTGHPSEIATPDDRAYVELGDPRGPIAYVCDFGSNAVTVEVLAPPLPPEPVDGTVVTTGKKVFLRQITATHGAELSWWRTADDEPWTWEQVCSTGAPIRLVLVSPGDAPDLPWTHTDADGDTLSITPNLQNDRLWVAVRAADNVNLFRREAAELGRALLAWAGEQR